MIGGGTTMWFSSGIILYRDLSTMDTQVTLQRPHNIINCLVVSVCVLWLASISLVMLLSTL